MKGSIRIIIGLLFIFGGVGTIETSNSISYLGIFDVILGFILMTSGINAHNKKYVY